MNIPDFISPIFGNRVWHWSGSGLVSLNGEPWPSEKALIAECVDPLRRIPEIKGFWEHREPLHQAPQSDCFCGIYAAKSADQLAGLGFRFYGICGEVYLWGTVIEHSLGWRAQFAYPRSLVLSDHTVPPSVVEAESFLAALTAYGADITLAGGEGNIPLWAKRSGYDKNGLEALRVVANQPIENTIRTAIFAEKPERATFIQKQTELARMAQISLSQGLPLSATDPIMQQLREQRVRVVLIDLNSERREECTRAIRVTRIGAGNLAILAIGDLRDRSMIVAARAAGADEYLDRNEPQGIADAVERHFCLINMRGRRVRTSARPRKSPPWGFVPPGGSPPGGSTPPAAFVHAPLGRGPRPMRPREVALALF